MHADNDFETTASDEVDSCTRARVFRFAGVSGRGRVRVSDARVSS
jgi:hypothetical protein